MDHHQIPRREPDPPTPWPLAVAWWALGFVGTLTFLALVASLTGSIL